MSADPRHGTSAVVPSSEWYERALAHTVRADRLTAARRERRARHETHAIDDFLYTYYPTRPGQLRRWHPGPGHVLAEPDSDSPGPVREAFAERARWRWYVPTPHGLILDTASFVSERSDTIGYVRDLLAATASRPARFGCLGLHEWAMVYRDHEAGRESRHPLPLRLGPEQTDTVVESHTIRCTHFDAFRFFTPEAVGRNTEQPTRASQIDLDQPGCLHANMDLYKWALKLTPAVPSDLVLDCFELARDVRILDMQASPYDVSAYGLAAVAIETPEGRAEYVRRQQAFAARAAALRARLVDASDLILGVRTSD